MRTVTQNAVNCFYNKENGNFNNTSVITEGNKTKRIFCAFLLT